MSGVTQAIWCFGALLLSETIFFKSGSGKYSSQVVEMRTGKELCFFSRSFVFACRRVNCFKILLTSVQNFGGGRVRPGYHCSIWGLLRIIIDQLEKAKKLRKKLRKSEKTQFWLLKIRISMNFNFFFNRRFWTKTNDVSAKNESCGMIRCCSEHDWTVPQQINSSEHLLPWIIL